MLVLALSWGLYTLLPVPGGFGVVSLESPAGRIVMYAKQFSPSIVGLLVLAVAFGRRGRRHLLGVALNWRAPIRWYVLTIVAFPMLMLGTTWLAASASGEPFLATDTVSVLTTLTVCLLGPVGEELFGWRGIALPLLVTRLGDLSAAAVLGVIWALWHVPPWVTPSGGIPLLSLLPGLVFGASLSVLMLYVYRRSGSALLAGVGVHVVHNTSAFVVNGAVWMGAFCLILIAVGVAVRYAVRLRRRRRPAGHGPE
ncbi:lysostaphin resistance A-like protein [Plantactinospora sp. CA-290183]|uniref:CPBP family intramembrane glutamic endopeptidase n=1 Tax=Plantactinospora sp. CA-290183 TaxID=3240006 RepID=UPI003D8C9F53